MSTKRDKYLQKTYGITQARYLEMAKYNYCWICGKRPKPGRNMNIDHDHKTGQIRGLLCWFCNKKLIGRHRRDDAEKFDRAAEYLRNTKDWRDE